MSMNDSGWRPVALFLPIALLGGLAAGPTRALASRSPSELVPVFADGFETGDTSRWPCLGLACDQVHCPGGGTTSVSGSAYAPNGTLPLPNVTVFVPNGPVLPFPAGAQCRRCSDPPSGNPLVSVASGADGSFVLADMPVGSNVPLVIQTGKWRRQVTLPTVARCVDTPLPAALTRLPKNQGEGDIPLLAVSTGAADALECLLRKTGVDDSEFSVASGSGRIRLFAGTGGTDRFDGAHGGQLFTASTTLWDTTPHLAVYDDLFLSCEGSQDPASKPPAALAAMKGYADLGGRAYAGHWHNYWIMAAPAPWNTLGTWNLGLSNPGPLTLDVSQLFARGATLAQWLFDVGASSSVGTLALADTRHTLTAIDEVAATKWLYKNVTPNGVPTVQYFSFTAPLEAALDQRCGRVVFSDIHVASGDSSATGLGFPSGGCFSPVTSLLPQEKLLLFMIFDLDSCVGTESN